MPIAPLPPFDESDDDDKVSAPPHLHGLADEIVRLNMLEVKELVDRIGDHFGFTDDDDYMDDDGGGGDGGGEKVEEVVEKTVFDLKLTGFDAKAKIKVIKEIRGLTSLGLKEAKELVEGAPVSHTCCCCYDYCCCLVLLLSCLKRIHLRGVNHLDDDDDEAEKTLTR